MSTQRKKQKINKHIKNKNVLSYRKMNSHIEMKVPPQEITIQVNRTSGDRANLNILCNCRSVHSPHSVGTADRRHSHPFFIFSNIHTGTYTRTHIHNVQCTHIHTTYHNIASRIKYFAIWLNSAQKQIFVDKNFRARSCIPVYRDHIRKHFTG